MYWMPAEPEQTTGDGVPSIFYEDRDLMNVRMKRLEHPRAWSQKTEWATNHIVGNIVIDKHDRAGGDVTVRSRFHMMEFRNDNSRHFAGSYVHQLKTTHGRLPHQDAARRHGQRPRPIRLRPAGLGIRRRLVIAISAA